MLLQMIITNELNKRLGHVASVAEQNKAFLYVADNMDDSATLNDINNILADFVSDNYCLCDICGEYVLRDEIIEVRNRFICGCNACADVARDEYNEWLADYTRRIPAEH